MAAQRSSRMAGPVNFAKIFVLMNRLYKQMEEALSMEQVPAEQDRRISETFERERPRLRRFIRQRLEDENDTDDVLQDVFLELVEAYRVFQPFEQVSAWLFRVARNRIIDLFRK